MNYRPEIDGLRALAVLPVIFFHAGFPTFAGGFVGVDVFFVISGYLITAILLDDLDRGQFSLVNFYERRARRILPALFAVMAACIPPALLLMTPTQLGEFAASLVFVTVFVSNFLFWQQSGYFDAAAEEKPLLHTWSLAVEEQYYIIFPILLLLLWSRGRNVTAVALGLIGVASLLLAEWGTRFAPSANFYLAPFRTWELLAGSLTAIYVRRATPANNDWLAGSGLIALVGSMTLFDDQVPFPSVYGLLPVLGTVAIIVFATGDSWVARLLRLKVMVGVGLISYSAYLWHQPLFAFYRLAVSSEHSSGHYGLLIGLTLALAYVSWRFVEGPWRNRQRMTRVTVFSSAAIGSVLLLGLGVVLPPVAASLTPPVVYTEALVETQKQARFSIRQEICAAKGWQTCDDAVPASTNVLIVGDSHGIDALNMLHLATRDAASPPALSMSALNGCPPLADIRSRVDRLYPNLEQCEALNRDERFSEAFLADYDVIAVNVLLADFSAEDLIDYLEFLNIHFKGDVVVFGGAFSFHEPLPALLNQHSDRQPVMDAINHDPRLSDPVLREAAARLGYQFISKSDWLCQRDRCDFVMAEGELSTYDRHHLSMAAAETLGKLIRQSAVIALPDSSLQAPAEPH